MLLKAMQMILFGFLLVSVRGFAADDIKPIDFTIHQEYTSTRALGMGNAFTAVADDHSAIFYNPAGLAFRKEGQLHFFLRAGTDTESLKLMDEVGELDKKPEAEQDDAAVDLVASHYGDHFYLRVPTLGGMWARPRWGVAFIPADFSLDMSVHRGVGPQLNVLAYLDSTLAVSFARQVKWFPKGHEFAWGTTVKAVHRVFVGKAILATELVEDNDVFNKSDAAEGLTADIDIGTMYKPRVPAKGFFKFLKHMVPTFSVVGRNLIDYGFKTNFNIMGDDTGEPPRLVRRFDFGSNFDLPNLWVFDPHIAFDIRDVLHENWTIKKGYHLGMELYWKMFNWWKGHWSVGLNQGYWTAGFGARLAWFQIDIASFGEEVGSDSDPIESRRYMLELSLDF